ncbi:hypothetical protein COCHEDRAFT_1083198, partial [Bipolaris maydis C5]
TYDQSFLRASLPVRSAVIKQENGGLVVRWVTTSESPLSYVFIFANFCSFSCILQSVRKEVFVQEEARFSWL